MNKQAASFIYVFQSLFLLRRGFWLILAYYLLASLWVCSQARAAQASSSPADQLTLVIPAQPSSVVQRAAEEVAYYVERMGNPRPVIVRGGA